MLASQILRERTRQDWRDLSLRAKTLLVIAIPVAALLLATASFWMAQRAESAASDLVDHSLDVHMAIDAVRLQLIDAEDGVRGYVLTGHSEWLEPFETARMTLPRDVATLTGLVADNAAQADRVEALSPLIQRRLDLMERVGAAGPSFAGTPRLQSQLAAGHEATEEVRELLAAMEAEEDALLVKRRAALEEARTLGTLFVGGTLGAGALGAILATLLLTSGVVRRLRAVQANAARLAAGESLEEMPSSRDEVGQLADALASARVLLLDRERSLDEARSFLEHLIETGPVLMLRLSLPSVGTRYVSPNVTKILGYDADEIAGSEHWWREHVHPEDRARIDKELRRAVRTGAQAWQGEWRFLRQDGRDVWVEAVVIPEYDAAGSATGLLVYCLDITDRKSAQAARDATELRLRTTVEELDDLYNNSPCGYHSLDGDGVFVRINDTELGWLGYTREELIGKIRLVDLLTPAGVATFATNFPVLKEQGSVSDLEFEIRHKDGTLLPVVLSATALYDAEGRFTATRSTVIDATVRREVEQAREAAREAAESANRAKSEFVSRMSHELRTPLNAILGFSQLLELDALTAEQAENVRYISRAGRHLLELVNEVLDISRVESGTMTISPEPVEIADVLAELIALVGPLADGRRIQVETSNTDCGCHVRADRQRLKQVLLNVLSNAVKYNREGGSITIGCTRVSSDLLRVSVSDTGYGIAPEYLARIFRPFDRLGQDGGDIEGTGMGLAVSKGLVEAMGGAMGVESTLDVGSTFWVDLELIEAPLEWDARIPEAAPHATAGVGRTILQIEDNEPNVRLVEQIVSRRTPHRVMGARQGRSGLDQARRHRPDLILLDAHLPDMHGLEVLRLLRTYPETRDVPVVVLSADATKGQVASFLAAGADAYLTKPLDVVQFLATLEETLVGPGSLA